MTTNQLIADLIERESGFVNDPHDRGGPTKYGITAQTLGDWRRLGRWATFDEVESLTETEAAAILRKNYVAPFLAVPFDELRANLVDMAVLEGQGTAIRALQQVLGVPVDGILGPRTLAAVAGSPWRLTNDALVAMRLKAIVDLVNRDASQREFLLGWVSRISGFVEGQAVNA